MSNTCYDFSEKQKNMNFVIEEMNACWNDVIHLAKSHSFSKGQVVDQADDAVYLITKGYISYSCYLHSGEKRILYFVGPNALFNEAGCMIKHRGRISFEFLTDTQVYAFPSNLFTDVDFVRSYPELFINLSQYIIFKRTYFSHFTANLFNRKPITRVAEILFQLHERKSEITISQHDIGNFFGLHQMTVSRALAQLRDENIIGKITKNNFEVFSPERLAKYAQW